MRTESINHVLSFLSMFQSSLYHNTLQFLCKYTLLQNKRGRWFRTPPPPPHRSFENRWRNIDILYIILRGIVWRFWFILNFSKIFWFREMTPQWLWSECPKNSDFYNMNISYIALKHVIWRFWICNNFYEIFKVRDFMNTLRNFAKFVLLVFSRNLNISQKNYITRISRLRALKWYIICWYFKSLNFFGHSLRSHWGVISRKFAHKFAKSKYFWKIKNNSESPDDSL